MSTPTILAQAQQRLAESLAQLPEGRRGAIAAVATTEGIKAAIVAKVNEDWQIEAFASKPWPGGEIEAGAAILWSWR